MRTRHIYSTFAALALLSGLPAAAGQQFKFDHQTITVPDGFEVELVAGTNLAPRPISGSFDEQGRLYVTDSSGSNEKVELQAKNPNHRVLRLEDTNGDGTFDQSIVFADQMMFPEGCLWYDGSLYVAAPPSIWKLTDTNNDGFADVRVEWHQGQTLTPCANDLHGPYLGPDGWIYWCKGAFAEQNYEVNGKPFKSRAAHIFRARPDGSRLEPVMTGGMDNPVGLTFTATGERILCGTFFAPDEPGHRDGLIHAIYGGVYGKPNNVLEGHKRTGELMPVMTHLGAAAPSAVIRYQSGGFAGEYRDNLFCCQFNLHKVSRHILKPVGATFQTTDHDFLVSDSTDFHPTDVIEDADGSLLVIDTGAWYKLCCPTSQLAKPDVLGGIYRIRRKGMRKVNDPRDTTISWAKSTPTELTALLSRDRPATVERAVQELARRGPASIPALVEVVQQSKNLAARVNAVWALIRIDAPAARGAVYAAFPDGPNSYFSPHDLAFQVAIYSISLWRDTNAVIVPSEDSFRAFIGLSEAVERQDAALQRTAAEAWGRIAADPNAAVRRLLGIAKSDSHNLPRTRDRILEHSLIYALIELNHPAATAAGLTNRFTQRLALIALDQMDAGNLRAEQVLPFLSATDAELRQTAAWVAGHHPEWGGALAGFFRERLAATPGDQDDRLELEKQLAHFTSSQPIQQLIAESLHAVVTPTAMRQLLLRVMAHSGLQVTPPGWAEAVRAALDQTDEAIIRPAIITARTLGQIKANAPGFVAQLHRLARDGTRPDDLRLDALAALPRNFGPIEPDLLDFLGANLDPSQSVARRSAAVSALTKLKLNDEQLLLLAQKLETIGPLEVSKLLAAFAQTTNEAVGRGLVAALQKSKGLSGINPGALKTLLAPYPPAVQTGGNALLTLLNVDEARQRAHLEELLATLPEGDIRGGQAVFNSPKAACSACHQIGYLGGKVGPNLTGIGTIRTERDLLEAIVYPNASFVRSYEPLAVTTKAGDDLSGVLRKDAPEEIILATGPNTEVRVPRADVVALRPGTVSVMPGGLEDQLTKQELANLVAFLKVAK
jgi:putative membrane-bound dehydrogenase-like protein